MATHRLFTARRVLRGTLVSCTLLAGAATTANCLNRPIDRIAPRTTSAVVERLTQNGIDKIDLLFVVDNSSSMADKQALLKEAIPALVTRLVQPQCVDDNGVPTDSNIDAEGGCEVGRPEFAPVRDINIGVISSSLGGALTNNTCKSDMLGQDDRGHLLTRALGGGTVPTFKDEEGIEQGYLKWDPDNEVGGETSSEKLAEDVGSLVEGAGQSGCGFEMPLEAAYRFLADPRPFDKLEAMTNEDGASVLMPVVDDNGDVVEDTELKKQRQAFLRPDSLVAVVILSDENDCSMNYKQQPHQLISGIKVDSECTVDCDYGGFYKGRSECTVEPTNECCGSCGLATPEGCEEDAACSSPKYAKAEDPDSLKCVEQMRKYGADFLFPVERYINAFSKDRIALNRADLEVGESGNGEPNPLFVSAEGVERPAGLVFVAGIVGVPWQAVAKENANGEPDLAEGLLEFEDKEEVLVGRLTDLVGDPDSYVRPNDPFMVESDKPRTDNSPILSEVLGTPTSPNDPTNPINGGDYDQGPAPSAPAPFLQHACTFPLPTENTDTATNDCTGCADTPCSGCAAENCDFPLCDDADQGTQTHAKAYPGLRHLALLRGLEGQAIFASICPSNTDASDKTARDYGYNPAVNGVVDALKSKLGGQCLPRELKPDAAGQVACLVIEVSKADTCNCDEAGREKIDPTSPSYRAVELIQLDDFAEGLNCFCEIKQLLGSSSSDCTKPGTDERHECLCNPNPTASTQGDGFCYIDAVAIPNIGNPELVEQCSPSEKRLVRFVGKGEPRLGATTFTTCVGE